MKDRLTLAALYGLFALSGAAGLVYESVWSHYLKLFLGHAAYAQALVLVIFMGGLALGAWGAGRYLARLRRLLLAYALVELVIGVLGMGFHAVFTQVIEWAFVDVLPAVEQPLLASVFKWLVAGLLVLPQAVLLGATFPLMSNGVIRLFPGRPGGVVATLYFSNSAGAAVGVLASGFVLIPAVGYPGTVLAAGLANVLVALAVYLLASSRATPVVTAASTAGPGVGAPVRLLLATALLTGTASFIYEIAWIRMLSMVFGASTVAFELMLATFIAGLALGGLWIRGRVDRLRSPVVFLGLVQVAMGIVAALTIPLYNHTFDLMAAAMAAIARNDAGFVLFGLLRGALASLVMLPATFLAGATLPLLTRVLLDRGHGEKSISHVYAANTFGAIAGVLFAVGVGLPLLGLERLMAVGSLIDIAIGVALIAVLGDTARRSLALRTGLAGVAVVVLLVTLVDFDTRRMASAVYRDGAARLPQSVRMLFNRDGRTASIAVWRHGPRVLLATNGKPDASIAVDDDAEPTLDDVTQTLLGSMPLAVHPGATRAAVIGMGSGTSSSALLGSPRIERVDTIEIEREVVAAAQYFRPRNDAVFDDPRSHVLVEDAKTVFAMRAASYDVIVSEPSNPWVSGVASLFTREFYAALARSLREGGVLVQWLQLYELDRSLLVSVLRALGESFTDYHLYAATDGDLIVIAVPRGRLPAPDPALFGYPGAARLLARVGITELDHLRMRWLGDRALLAGLLETPGVPVNSDYFPILDTRAERARFLRANTMDLARWRVAPLPLVDLLAPAMALAEPAALEPAPDHAFSARVSAAQRLLAAVTAAEYAGPVDGFDASLARLASTLADLCEADHALWLSTVLNISADTAAYLAPVDGQRLWRRLHGACGSIESRRVWLDLFAAIAVRDARAMGDAARSLLAAPGPWSVEQRRYLLACRVLSLMVQGDAGQAAAVWAAERAALFGADTLPVWLALLESLLPRLAPARAGE